MSQVPASTRTTPAQRRCPKAINPAAKNMSATPTTVTWLGVSGVRPSAVISASACRRTQASNRVVNIRHLQLHRGLRGLCLARLLVDVDDLGRDPVPRVAPSLFQAIVGEPVPKLRVAGQDHERRRELAPVLGLHGDAVLAGL